MTIAQASNRPQMGRPSRKRQIQHTSREKLPVAVHCAKSGGDMKVGEVVDFRDGKDSIT